MANHWDEALTSLVTDRSTHLLAYGRLLTGSADAAQDLFHDALVKVCARRTGDVGKALRSDLAGERLEGYVRRAMATMYIDRQRREGRWRRVLRLSARPEHLASEEDSIADMDEFSRALATLSPRGRACVILRHYEQLSTRETAQVLGIAEGTVKSYLSEAISLLRGTLSPPRDGAAGETTVPESGIKEGGER